MNTDVAKTAPVWVAGFMSGTSLDGVDAAMILTDGHAILDFGPVASRGYSDSERAVLQMAVAAARVWNWEGAPPQEAFLAASDVLTRTHHEVWQMLTDGASAPRPVLAGVHGQTVLHRRARPLLPGRTLQLADGPALARAFGVRVIHDFRSADVAAGGQGAPLAPAYHEALLRRLGPGPGCVLNLGGVANITMISSDGSLTAFDTGPANGPIDEWVEGHGKGRFDENGRIAQAGRVHHGLLATLLGHDWFDEPAPKSLDRYDFNASMVRGLSLEDGAATLTEFSAASVAAGLRLLDEAPVRLVVCGGGRHNPSLMAALRRHIDCELMTAEDAGWRGDAIEAEAFAFLAQRSLMGLAISWPGTTGVPVALSGGVLSGYAPASPFSSVPSIR